MRKREGVGAAVVEVEEVEEVEAAALSTAAHLRLNMHNSHAKRGGSGGPGALSNPPRYRAVSARVNRLISQHRLLSMGQQGHLQL